MKINLLIAFLAISILSFTALFDVNYLNYSAPVPYSRIKTINFYDFKGYKLPFETLNGHQEFAFIKTNRKIKLLDNNKVEIVTYFHPSRSFVYNQHIRENDLLTHELYHFHLSEYVTRLFRKEISDSKNKLTESELNNKAEKYLEIEDGLQRSYDEESNHSLVFSEQKRWETFINSGLESLQDYKDSIVIPVK